MTAVWSVDEARRWLDLHDTGHEQVDSAVDVLRGLVPSDLGFTSEEHEAALDEIRSDHRDELKLLADQHDAEIKALRLELDPKNLTWRELLDLVRERHETEVVLSHREGMADAATRVQDRTELAAPPPPPKRRSRSSEIRAANKAAKLNPAGKETP